MRTHDLSPSRWFATILLGAVSALAQERADTRSAHPERTQGAEKYRTERLIYALNAYSQRSAKGHLRLRSAFPMGQEHPIFGRETLPGGLLYVAPQDDPRNKARARRGRRVKPTQHTVMRTNRWALQRLLSLAEEQPSPKMARAVLPIAGIGLNASLFDPSALQVRELGHWTLMRMDDNRVWLYLNRIAVGDVFDAMGWLRGEKSRKLQNPANRVAAIRLLGERNHSVFRPVVETGLSAADPRVRLAAAEALYRMGRHQSFSVLTRALAGERHGVVAQALMHALARQLRKHGSRFTQDDRDRAIRACHRLLGNSSWRVQMDAVDLIADYPMKDSVPALIEVMKRQEIDLLRDTVNRNASPFLQRRAWEALKLLTGVKLPLRADAWEQFWEKHKDNLKVVDLRFLQQLPQKKKPTKATFYGIPVEGGEIAFVIDTSGSMKEKVYGTIDKVDKGKYRTRTSRRRRRLSRLDHAKKQLQTAVQTLDPRCRYHLYTFSGSVTQWHKRPVRPNRDSFRALTACLGKIRPGGGTNMYGALLKVLQARSLRFGQEPKIAVDEVFLLSDGQIGNTDQVLEVVKEINRYARVRINTVFTGKGSGAGFLKELAELTGGVFVKK